MEKGAPGDRRTGTPGRKGTPFSIAELTPKGRQPQESSTETGMRSAKQAASQLRTSRNNPQPVMSEKQAAQPGERVRYRRAGKTMTEQPTRRGEQSTPDSSASNLGFGRDV